MADWSTWAKWLGATSVGLGVLALARSALASSTPATPVTPPNPPLPEPPTPVPKGPALPVVTLPPFKASMSYLDGIDVSKWQGQPGGTGLAAPIDWDKVAASGVRFAICKATHGSSEDSSFAYNWGKTTMLLARGAYCYGRCGDSPVAQAEALVVTCQKRGGLRASGDLLAVDLEWIENEAFKHSTARWEWWIRSFVARIAELTSRPTLIYTSSGFWDFMGNPSIPEISGYPLWVANYTNAAEPSLPPPWKVRGWTIWQYQGDSGPARTERHVPGIVAVTDRDFYRGDAASLVALTEVRIP